MAGIVVCATRAGLMPLPWFFAVPPQPYKLMNKKRLLSFVHPAITALQQ